MAVMKLARSHKGVVFDLAGTLLWEKKGYWVDRARIYRRVGKLPTGIHKRVIEDTVDVIRAACVPLQREWTIEPYWMVVNGFAVQYLKLPRERQNLEQFVGRIKSGQALLKVADLMVGFLIHRDVQELNGHRHRLDPEVGKMLKRLALADIFFCLGTNHKRRDAERWLDGEFAALGRWFPSELRFTPTSENTYKPDPEFLVSIAGQIILDPRDVVYVGNSTTTDAPMVESGALVILLNRDGHYDRKIADPEFQERYREALKEHRLIILRRPKDVADTLIAHYEEAT